MPPSTDCSAARSCGGDPLEALAAAGGALLRAIAVVAAAAVALAAALAALEAALGTVAGAAAGPPAATAVTATGDGQAVARPVRERAAGEGVVGRLPVVLRRGRYVVVVVLGAGHASSPISECGASWCGRADGASSPSYASGPTIPRRAGRWRRGGWSRGGVHATGPGADRPTWLSTGCVDNEALPVENRPKPVNNPVDTSVDNHTIAPVSTR